MNIADIVVLLACAAAIGGLGWYFFAPARPTLPSSPVVCSGWR